MVKDCNLNQKTFWYRMIRIDKNMENRQSNLLRGILEMDETYIGGNPGKNNEQIPECYRKERDTIRGVMVLIRKQL